MKKILCVVLGAAVSMLVMFEIGMAADKGKGKEEVSPQQKSEALFVEMDTDKDGKISKLEYVTYHKIKAENRFNKLDKDGDTYLVKEEITITKVPKKAKGESKATGKKDPAAK